MEAWGLDCTILHHTAPYCTFCKATRLGWAAKVGMLFNAWLLEDEQVFRGMQDRWHISASFL